MCDIFADAIKPVVSEGLNFVAGYGIKLLLCTPSLHDLGHLYGPHNNFVEASHIRVVFAQLDDSVARRFSGMTGMHTYEKQRHMVAREAFHTLHDRTAVTTELEEAPLLSPTELLRLPKDQVLLLVGQQAVLLRKAWYFRHSAWRKRSRIAKGGGPRP